ncbi:MAG: hypothetical protein EA398_13790, partial [Deltaproteobacteria bacterium]
TGVPSGTEAPPSSTPSTDTTRVHLGPWTLTLGTPDDALLPWALSASDRTILSGRDARLATGSPRISEPAGQIRVELEGRGMTWTSATHAELLHAEQDSAALRLRFDDDEHGRTATLSFRLLPGERLRVGLDVDDDPLPTAELLLDCQPDEAFFGLGTQITTMNLAGRTFPLITQEQGIGKPERSPIFGLQNSPEAAYAPMATWHSSAGYSAIGDFDTYADLGLCASRDDTPVSFLRTHLGHPALVLVPGDSIRERMAPLTAGVLAENQPDTPDIPAALPDWVFGPWLTAVGGPDEIALVRRTARERGWPVSAIWSEDWIGGSLRSSGFRLSYRWEWDPDTYPDLPDLVADLNRDGFAFLGYFNPFVPNTVPHFEEARDRGFLVARADGEPFITADPAGRNAGLIDLFNPDAVAFVQGYLRTAAQDVGLHGWMADFAEWYPHTARVPDGVSPFARRNQYPVLWQQTHREVLDDVHGPGGHVFFARSGWASTGWRTGSVLPAMWGGDQNTDWQYDDGYPTVLPIAAHVGLSGVPVFGADIAGYASFINDPSDKELWFRWATLGAMGPLMRTHHGSSKCDNWRFDRDEDTLLHFGRWLRIHSLLLPLFRRAIDEARTHGLPIVRHPVLVHPEHPQLHEGDQYAVFLGDDLLVAPVLEQGATTREVLLPGRGWWPLFADEPITDGAHDDGLVRHTAVAPPTEIPVFVRPGTALPLLGREVDTFFPTDHPDLRDLRHAEGTVRTVLYPDLDGDIPEQAWDAVRIAAEGLPEGAAPRAVADDDGPLPACTASERERPAPRCIDHGGRLIRGAWADATLQVGQGSVRLSSSDGETRHWTIGIGGAIGWGELAEPTPLGSLDPDLPPLCPDEPEPSGTSAQTGTPPSEDAEPSDPTRPANSGDEPTGPDPP